MSTEEREDLAAQLRETERGEAASWVTYPPSPWWWPLAFGAWTFLYVLALGLLDGVAQAGATFPLALVMVGVIAWERRRRGSWPTGRPPQQLRRPMTVLFAGLLGIAGVAWLVGKTVGTWPAAALAGVAVAGLVWWYGAAYDRVATQLRGRPA